MSWRVALYDFIHARNQMEVDYDWSGPVRATGDEAYAERLRLLQDRRRRQHRERGLVPLSAETRLRILDVRQEEAQVCAGIMLQTRLEGESRGVPCETETQQIETVLLTVKPGGKWMIASVSPRLSESSEAASSPTALEAGEEDITLPSVQPLLVREKLAPWKTGGRYNRELVRQYAERYWNSSNPKFIQFDVDCSNYVSQCILAGGIPMHDTGRRETGWWYRGRSGSQELWSYSWAVANALQAYLSGTRPSGLRAVAVDSPKKLDIGDVISYSWDGDGRYGHSTIVTAFDPQGMPLVNAHTVNSRHRYWDYSDSYAWTERTKYKFFHIGDE
ncbi:amidase domain-containing protein [Gorillibacterium sp. sgz5001074]|uniref:amidase domain-containing protein n=1 Tax=Gorillibacterium sp. sgz5001074 TaxID=3446695 RepID=UPI003F67B1B9